MMRIRGKVTAKQVVIGLGVVALVAILALKVVFVAGPTKKAGSNAKADKDTRKEAHKEGAEKEKDKEGQVYGSSYPPCYAGR